MLDLSTSNKSRANLVASYTRHLLSEAGSPVEAQRWLDAALLVVLVDHYQISRLRKTIGKDAAQIVAALELARMGVLRVNQQLAA